MHHERYDWRIDFDYWNYTLYEYNYDWEAAIRYMVDTTDYSQVAMAAVSHRAANSLMGMSTSPDFYHENISVMILLSPQFRYDFSESLSLRMMANGTGPVEFDEASGAVWYWPPKNTIISILSYITQDYLCEQYPVICMEMYNAHTNRDIITDDIESYQTLTGHMAETTTTRELAHVQQMVRTGVRYFDYGEEENLERYGASEPPAVPFENINTPCALFSSKDDLYQPPLNSHAVLDMLGDNLVFFNVYRYSTYGYYTSQNVTDWLEDAVHVLEAYPPNHD
eukprot:CAMPEP_0205819450 /NCGR_PEP_ID=MMETSP0206-20130828/1836_1 /ASSEMBLY_ACC=CAM_ASM_000279 /TAXON_ID=36767 /ORGANISM="Euplotes focardii, Strain TN1" /LENGTH=280 /DNA_ID=CAMNT_0053113065 /DNA_START=333 /DNA_END=1175 /DNA_ORIENTATION=-